MIYSLVPVDSFWLVRPILQLVLSLLFYVVAIFIKKWSKLNLLSLLILNVGAIFLIGEFAKIDRLFTIILGLVSTFIIYFLKRFSITKLIFITTSLLILLLSNQNKSEKIYENIYLYGFMEKYSSNIKKNDIGKKGLSKFYHGLQWGELESTPLRGRYSLPENTKPSPIVFILHGNHLAEEDSHKGYDYLLDELGKSGYIGVSIDQNFLNGDWTNLGNGYPEKNNLRAYGVSSTIDLFLKFNKTPTSKLYNRIDINNISIIGHSRGGEAASILASYDKRVKRVIALAPTYGQYKKSTKLHNVDYFVIQGSNDGDLRFFRGINQFKRTNKSNKKSLLIAGFNHSGFNSDWGVFDGTGPGNIFYDRNNNYPPELQQEITKKLIIGYLDFSIGWKPDNIKSILEGYNLEYTLNSTIKDEVKLYPSTVLNSGYPVKIKKKSDTSNRIMISIYNPTDKFIKLDIEDNLNNRYELEVKPGIKWNFLRYNFLQKELARDNNPHTYTLSINESWEEVIIKSRSNSTLYIDRISTLHQRIE